MVGNEPIDTFLRRLGLEVEGNEEPLKEYDVNLVISFLEEKYYLNCLISGQELEKEVQGIAVPLYFIVAKTTLADVCGRVEKGLDEYEIAYHRSIPISPGPSHTNVHYELLPRLIDPKNDLLVRDLAKMLDQIISGYNTGRR